MVDLKILSQFTVAWASILHYMLRTSTDCHEERVSPIRIGPPRVQNSSFHWESLPWLSDTKAVPRFTQVSTHRDVWP